MLSQLFLESSDEADQFLTWILPRVNYRNLLNRLKYAPSGSRVVLFEYHYPKHITTAPSLVDMIPIGTTIHDLLLNDSCVRHIMDKLFCAVDGMHWYTRSKIIHTGSTSYECPNVRQVVLIVQSKPPMNIIDTDSDTDSMPELILPTTENFYSQSYA